MVFLGVWQSRRISGGFRNGKVIEVFLCAKITKLPKKMAIFPWFRTVEREFVEFVQSAQRAARRDVDGGRVPGCLAVKRDFGGVLKRENEGGFPVGESREITGKCGDLSVVFDSPEGVRRVRPRCTKSCTKG